MNENIKEAMEIKQMRIDKAIDRKEKGIAYFNSLNSAISFHGVGSTLEEVFKTRDRFYQEWKNWYATNVLYEQSGDEIEIPVK